MTAYFGCVDDNTGLSDPKSPAHVFDALRTWKLEKLSSVLVNTTQDPHVQCDKRAFVMCGTTPELKEALLSEPNSHFACSTDFNDVVCVTYVRIDARTRLRTRETVSVICLAPLVSWWGVEVNPSELKKFPDYGSRDATELDQYKRAWQLHVSQAGHGQG